MFAEVIFISSVGRAKPQRKHRGLAVVAKDVGNELAAAIGRRMSKVKSERHDEVLHELGESQQDFVVRRDQVPPYTCCSGFLLGPEAV